MNRIGRIGRITTMVTIVMGVFLLAACGGGSAPATTRPGPAEPEVPRPPAKPGPAEPEVPRPPAKPGPAEPEVPRPPAKPDPAEPEVPRPPAKPDPADQLGTPRFTTHQPGVLEQVGAHHAYARGLTGRGVRIGIEDTIVDYTQTAEFGSRVRLRDADGAQLAYSHPLGDDPFSDVARCRRNGSCSTRRGDSQGDEEARNRWVRQIVSEDGWPRRDDASFFFDEHFAPDGSIDQLYRWWEVPTPYGRGAHGTTVASVAAGTRLGVAPQAAIIPVATNLTDDQREGSAVQRWLQDWITTLPAAERRRLDDQVAREVRSDYEKFDIINRSYGRRASRIAVISSIDAARWYRRYLPKTLDALWQTDRSAADKTIVVYAAGNDRGPVPGLGALRPAIFPALRDHSLAVVATDPRTGRLAGYSNRCGRLPPDWNAARHGRHYCLAAPGTVRGLVPDPDTPGRGNVGTVHGTSFAAPIVSGALALLKEHFRGTRGNTELVRRVIDTADRNGRYADLETYGAGHLDIAAALSPVGPLTAGASARALDRTALRTPAAFGPVAQRAAGIELAAFDAQDFPFWVPLSGLVSSRSGRGRSPIPELVNAEPADADGPASGLAALGLHWAAIESAPGLPSADDRPEWVMGLGPSSASLARLPSPHGGGWGYGFSFDSRGYLGSRTSGAFGSDLRSGMIWTARAFERALGEGWTLSAGGTLALSVPQYEDDAIFSASPSLMSAASVRIGTGRTGLTVEQPLRAESGAGTFRVENGRTENGRRLHDEHRIPLRPDARELRMELRHEREALGGEVAVEAGHSMNAGHVPGESETGIGLAYRVTW